MIMKNPILISSEHILNSHCLALSFKETSLPPENSAMTQCHRLHLLVTYCFESHAVRSFCCTELPPQAPLKPPLKLPP